MGERIRLGVIGIGLAWDKLHWPALKQLGGKYEVAAVCNRTLSKAEAFAETISLPKERVYDDYRRMIERDDLDAVDVLVPISENFEVARDVLNTGRHLIAEKPFASTAEGVKELIALKNQKNLIVMVAENILYDQETLIIKELLTSGELGEAVSFTHTTGADFDKGAAGSVFFTTKWRQHPSFEGGSFIDGGVHDIAQMRFLFGDVESLYADGRPHEKDYCPYDTIAALLRFKSGVIGQFTYCSARAERTSPPMGLRIACTKGDIYLESKYYGNVRITRDDGSVEERPFTPSRGYLGEMLNFWDAVKNGGAITATPEAELGDIELIYDILRSARGKRPVIK
ncbi:MAG: Gfo/Idh/MocA family oxidoreductase [Oscillospiraceae bacterium]|nr:Gfo/Idh/MocA family oxidoreductase [Oscillospiraceae bacterium]